MYLHYLKVCKAVSVHRCATASLIARFMGPTWGPSGADRTQVGPMLALNKPCYLGWSLALQALAGIPIERPNGRSCCNSKTTGSIHAMSSSMESSLMIDVQRHGHCPVWPLQKFPLIITILVEAVTPQLVNRFTPSQVLGNHHGP